MGLWAEQVLPRLTDKVLDVGEIHKLRARVCEGLSGDVVELGFGSGHNYSHYPPAVTKVYAVEPSDVAWRLAGRHDLEHPEIVRAGLDGERLALSDASCAGALSTYTMCTIPGLDAAIAEVVRVLKPGGAFHFLEHGHSPDPKVARWQDRLTPLQRRVAGGCHLNRPISEYVERAGLLLERLDTFYGEGPKSMSYYYLGLARKA